MHTLGIAGLAISIKDRWPHLGEEGLGVGQREMRMVCVGFCFIP